MNRIGCNFDIAISTILKANRSRDTRSKFTVNLAFCGSCSNRAPRNKVADVLRRDHIQEFATGRHAHAVDLQQQLTRQGCANAHLDLAGVQQHCSLDGEDRHWLENACERLGLSLRAAHRVMKVARTLADLDDAASIGRTHLAEALQYRPSLMPE